MRVEYFDLRAVGVPGILAAKGKAPSPLRWRDMGDVNAIVLHQWGAIVGIGKRARAAVEAGRITEARAIAERGTAAPYHFAAGVDSAGDPFEAHVWRPELYTWASNERNATTVAVGIMGRFPRLTSQWRPGRHSPANTLEAFGFAGRAAVRRAARVVNGWAGDSLAGRQAQESRADRAPLILTHSQIHGPPPARADRSSDPGEAVIALVVAPLVAAGVVRVNPDLCEYGGDPWPREWRRHLEAAEVAAWVET